MSTQAGLNNVPFYSNTPDNTHCFQAALKMILKYFIPNKDYSWKELEELSGKKEGLWTWVTKGIINMRKLGFDVIVREDFDYGLFITKGENYLKEKYGEEVSKEQIKNSDICYEIEIAKEYVKLFGTDFTRTSLDEIKSYIDKDYLLIVNVNAAILNGEKGFVGHFVVVYGYDNETIYVHDPGLPAKESRSVSIKDFVTAWEYPDKEARNFIAFKYLM